MFKRSMIVLVALLTLSVANGLVAQRAEAGVTDTLKALAPPLAAQFGVPSNAVQTLFDKGIGLETTTELLLVSQAASKSIGDVTKLFESSKRSVDATAQQLNVAKDAYSADKVQAAIDKAKADAQKQAADEASKAAGSAVGGLLR